MTALTNASENASMNWLTGQTAANSPPPVLPLMVALETVGGTDAAPGTEVSGGSYARQPVAFTIANLANQGQASNIALVRFNNMPDVPAPGVQAFAIWDSAPTPVRWWHAPLTVSRTYVAGDAAEFPANELVLGID